MLAEPAPFISYHRQARQGGDYGRVALHRLSQSRRDEEGRRCQGHDLAALERQLKKGDKTFVGNMGYRRFLATPDDDHFVIDCAKAEEDAKFDDRTNTGLSWRPPSPVETWC